MTNKKLTKQEKDDLRFERRQMQRRENQYIGSGCETPAWIKERIAEITKTLAETADE
jgi:hypothetical protein